VIGVYPGSFDPPTIAHVAIAEAAVHHAGLERLDFALSQVALGKEDRAGVEARRRVLARLVDGRPELAVVVTDAQLIAEIARGYDVVVMGADKWAQVNDVAWYDSPAARDAALAALPRVLVVPRSGFGTEGAEVLDVAADLAEVSSSAARAGADHLVARLPPRRLIVDAMNVIGTRPDGWWRDRAGASRRLIGALQDFARRRGDLIAVVLDGRPLPDIPEGVHDGVLVAYARRIGRDAADDRIVEEVGHDRDPSSLVVVTSDQGLRERVHTLGARTEGAGQLLSDLALSDLESENP
jgi:nicotinic acid mononucleotide adenylyltransferase/predicted RNA-binding protein with PIN domain